VNSADDPQARRPARIIVRGVNWLGDAVMSTPALLRLQEAYPDAFIGLVTPSKLAGLWTNHPAVDSVLRFEPGEGAFSIGRRVRAEQFEIGLVLPNSFQSAFEFWWASVPQRIGYAGQIRTWLFTHPVAHRAGAVRMRKRSKGEIVRLLKTATTEPANPTGQWGQHSAAAHHLHQYLHLAAQLGANSAPLAPQLFLLDAEVTAALHRHGIDRMPDRPLFALNPGAEYGPAKRWPMERYIAAAREVQRQSQCRWLLLGGKADRELAQQIVAGIQSNAVATDSAGPMRAAINLAGATSLRELCAILKACRVLLTNDTGPMHVAAAVGTPVVVPFGSTDPELTGPGLPGDSRHRLLRGSAPCAPCFLRDCPVDFRCMRSIEVQDVVAAVLSEAAC
jgi:heptosyltransferase II